jgi:hypothetical protein
MGIDRRTWTDKQLVEAVASCTSMSAVIRKLGLKVHSGNYRTLRYYIDQLELDTGHWVPWTLPAQELTNKMSLQDALVADSPYKNNTHLKKRLLREGILANKCVQCGLEGMWCEEPIVMRLDHINGNCRDNRLENLRILCPNCDSQTDTFAGRNNKNVKKVRFCSSCEKPVTNNSKTGLCRNCSLTQNRARIPKNEYPICNLPECGVRVTRRSNKYCSSECASKSRRLVERPSKEQLQKDIQSLNFLTLSKKYGVSDNAVRKWAQSYNLSYK